MAECYMLTNQTINVSATTPSSGSGTPTRTGSTVMQLDIPQGVQIKTVNGAYDCVITGASVTKTSGSPTVTIGTVTPGVQNAPTIDLTNGVYTLTINWTVRGNPNTTAWFNVFAAVRTTVTLPTLPSEDIVTAATQNELAHIVDSNDFAVAGEVLSNSKYTSIASVTPVEESSPLGVSFSDSTPLKSKFNDLISAMTGKTFFYQNSI